jgi:hypothetical protein
VFFGYKKNRSRPPNTSSTPIPDQRYEKKREREADRDKREGEREEGREEGKEEFTVL